MTRRRRKPSGLLLASLALLTVAVGAAAFLWSTRTGSRGADHVLGGPLFGPPPTPIDALLVNVGGRACRFDRQTAGGWTLSGSVSDDLDQRVVAALLDSLATADAGPLLPGTEPNDRRFEFNGPEGVQLTVHHQDGSHVDLALGAVNPVNGRRYASGAGRRFCFTVDASLRDRLAALPDAARAREVLPGVAADAIERITLERDGATWALERSDGRWWLAAPDGAAGFGPLAAQYHARYDDRRRGTGTSQWLLASDAAIAGLIHEITGIKVRELAPPGSADELAPRWGLAPPWRRVTLQGAGVRPALAGAPGDDGAAPTIAFGPALDERVAPALRRGNVLVVDREAINMLAKPLATLLELGAFAVPALTADAISVTWEGRPLLRGARRGTPDPFDGRKAWLADLPTAADWQGSESDRHDHLRDLVVNLNRQPILAVLEPRTIDPLRPDGRVGVELTAGTGTGARTWRWELGWLRDAVGGATAAVWVADTGQLLVLPDVLLISMRNAAAQIAPRR